MFPQSRFFYWPKFVKLVLNHLFCVVECILWFFFPKILLFSTLKIQYCSDYCPERVEKNQTQVYQNRINQNILAAMANLYWFGGIQTYSVTRLAPSSTPSYSKIRLFVETAPILSRYRKTKLQLKIARNVRWSDMKLFIQRQRAAVTHMN